MSNSQVVFKCFKLVLVFMVLSLRKQFLDSHRQQYSMVGHPWQQLGFLLTDVVILQFSTLPLPAL